MRVLLANSYKSDLRMPACGGSERLLLHVADALRKRDVDITVACVDQHAVSVPVLTLRNSLGHLDHATLTADYLNFVRGLIPAFSVTLAFDLPELLAEKSGRVICWYMNDRDEWLPRGVGDSRNGALFVSHDLQQRFVRHHTNHRLRLRVLPPFVDTEQFSSRGHTYSSESDGALRILAASMWHPRKGIHDYLSLCEAVRALGIDYTSTLAGGIDLWSVAMNQDDIASRSGLETYDSTIRRRASRIDNLTIAGIVSHGDMAALYQSADVFCLLSYFREGLPISLIEAMASGCTVLATSVGGITELVEHGRNGFLVRPGDVASGAQFIADIASGIEDTHRFGLEARNTALRYGESVIVGRLLRFLSKIAA